MYRCIGVVDIARKHALSDAVDAQEKAARAAGEKWIPYCPQTWVLPRDLDLLASTTNGMRHGRNYILKPSRGNQGDGIKIVRDLSMVTAALDEAKVTEMQFFTTRNDWPNLALVFCSCRNYTKKKRKLHPMKLPG